MVMFVCIITSVFGYLLIEIILKNEVIIKRIRKNEERNQGFYEGHFK